MEISIRYFTAIREEIRKNATENQSGIGPGGKGPIQQSLGKGKVQEPQWQRFQGRTLRENKYKYRSFSTDGSRNHTPETICKEKP